jgi:hypothetical protein
MYPSTEMVTPDIASSPVILFGQGPVRKFVIFNYGISD